jgi:hypothetical protein
LPEALLRQRDEQLAHALVHMGQHHQRSILVDGLEDFVAVYGVEPHPAVEKVCRPAAAG